MKNFAKRFGPTGLTICLAALLTLSAATSVGAAETGKPAPAWELKDVEGKAVKSADYAGKVVILDFWATWCPPCRKEIPGFIELQKQYSDKGLVVIGVSLDQDGPSVVKKFAKQQAINYPLVMAEPKTLKDFGGVEAIPTTFVIDRAGKIVSKHVGYVEKSAFEAEIKPLLDDAKK